MGWLHSLNESRLSSVAIRDRRSLVLFPLLFIDTQGFGELVFQDDDPAGRLERGALVDETIYRP